MQAKKNIKSILDRHFTKVFTFFAIFYFVGILGISMPFSSSLFMHLIPLALLLSTAAVLIFHTDYSPRTILVFTIIFLTGFSLEVIGVKTGHIFGNYTYHNGLGLQLLNTPLIIGINWLLLTYIAYSTVDLLKTNKWTKIFFTASLLLTYDLILEPVAPLLNMWSWENNRVPVRNYIAWFVIALFFAALLKYSGINMKNRMAPVILICQLLFFTTILITLK